MILKFRDFICEQYDNNISDKDIEKEINISDIPNTPEKIKEKVHAPEEFTGDYRQDSYLNWIIFVCDDEDSKYINLDFNNVEDDRGIFKPLQKAQKEGNKYNEIWNALVNWIKKKQLDDLDTDQKDNLLVKTFYKIINRQKNLIHSNDKRLYVNSADTDSRFKLYNVCKDKFEKLTKFVWKVYPNPKDDFQRSQLRRKKYEDFLKDNNIDGKKFIPNLSKIYRV